MLLCVWTAAGVGRFGVEQRFAKLEATKWGNDSRRSWRRDGHARLQPDGAVRCNDPEGAASQDGPPRDHRVEEEAWDEGGEQLKGWTWWHKGSSRPAYWPDWPSTGCWCRARRQEARVGGVVDWSQAESHRGRGFKWLHWRGQDPGTVSHCHWRGFSSSIHSRRLSPASPASLPFSIIPIPMTSSLLATLPPLPNCPITAANCEVPPWPSCAKRKVWPRRRGQAARARGMKSFNFTKTSASIATLQPHACTFRSRDVGDTAAGPQHDWPPGQEVQETPYLA